MELAEVLVTYMASAQKISQTLVGHNSIDAMGDDREDYAHDLFIVGWEAQTVFRDQYGFCMSQESKYVHACMWNKARNVRRDNGRLCVKKFSYDRSVLRDLMGDTGDLHAQVEARVNLAKIRASCTEDEWFTLLKVADNGGIVAQAFPGSMSAVNAIQRKVSRLRYRAAELLDR